MADYSKQNKLKKLVAFNPNEQAQADNSERLYWAGQAKNESKDIAKARKMTGENISAPSDDFDPDAYLASKETGDFDPDAYLAQQSNNANSEKIINPTDGMTTTEKVLAGIGKGFVDSGRGLGQIVGLTSQADIDEAKKLDEALMKTGAGNVGNIIGNAAVLAPTAFIPGANTVVGGALIGGISGGATTGGSLKDRAKAAGFSALGGGVGAKLSSLAKSATPAKVNPDVELLQKSGVYLTPGQNAGGILKAFEDKATSIPLLGDIINASRKRGIEDFNKAAISRAKLPNMQVDGIGNAAMQDLRTQLGQNYDNLLSKSNIDLNDPQFAQNLNSLTELVSALPKQEQRAFKAIIDRELKQRTAPNGMLNGENLQGAKSGLGEQINNFANSTDAYQRQLGQALKQADAELRDLVARTNPNNAKEQKALDLAYANFKRLQKAASGVGAENGVFTPAQLHNAVRAADKTKDKRAFSEGDALLQDLSAAGKNVMPSKVPDSGTAGRLMNNLFSLQGLMSMSGGAAASLPALLAYSPVGSRLINTAVNKAALPSKNALIRLLSASPDATRIGSTALANFASQ